ncbi:hypothetical protein THAOC_02680, partial [Thalassiosira oceanica]
AMGAVIGPPGEAMEELDSPYRRCVGRADRDRQGAAGLMLILINYTTPKKIFVIEQHFLYCENVTASPLGNSFVPNLDESGGQFWPFPLSSTLLTMISGAAEEPLRSPAQISGWKEVQMAQMVPGGHAALQGLSSIPYLTSVAAGFYRNDVINGSGTSAGRARAMMSKFAVTPARLR